MKFNQEFIEKVRDANNIVDLISQHTQLKPSSGGYMGRCPFPDHQEKTASFSVSEAKQVYYCFGCHKKGNIFKFVQELMGLNFPQSIEYLASRANISLPVTEEDNSEQERAARHKKQLMQVSQLAMQFFTEQFKRLPANHPAKVYATTKRQLSPEILKEYHVGYAPEEWDGLTQFLKSKGANLALAEEARLIKPRKEGNGHYDIFRDRLMFPILSAMAEPIAFGGRIIAQGEPKYLNSGESPIFTKGKVLYGLSQSAKYIRSDDQVIVVEGYMDVVALFQADIKNVVATMGTAFTPDHARIFSRMTKNVAVLFDGDEAGQHAAERSLPILLGADLHPKGLILPDGQDPDDFVKNNGAQALRELLAQAPDLYSMVLSMWMQSYRGEASEKVKLADKLKPVFISMRDPRLRGLYVSETAKKMSVDESWLNNALGFAEQKMAPVATRSTQVSAPRTNPFMRPPTPAKVDAKVMPTNEPAADGIMTLRGASKAERTLLSLALKNSNNFNKIIEVGIIVEIPHSGVRQVLEKAADKYRQDPEKFDKLAGLLTSFVDEPDLIFAYDTAGVSVSSDSEPEGRQSALAVGTESAQEMETRLLSDCMKRIRDKHLQAMAEKLSAEIKIQATPEKLQQLMNIQRDRRALNRSSF